MAGRIGPFYSKLCIGDKVVSFATMISLPTTVRCPLFGGGSSTRRLIIAITN